MPNRIVLKKGTTAGTAPSASDLVAGELAINTADGGLFTKLDDGSIYTVSYRNTEGLPVARGGTGATSASSARANLGLSIGTNVQAWDADLDAIAALSGTSGLLRKTEPSGPPEALAFPAVSWPNVGMGENTVIFTDAPSFGNVNWSVTAQPDRLYLVTYTVISISSGEVRVDLGSSVGTVRTAPGTYSEVLLQTSTNLSVRSTVNGTNAVVEFPVVREYFGSNNWLLDTASYLTGNQSITVSGDATGSGTTALTLTLANSGVSAGTYNDSATSARPFTVDAKGRVTAIGTAVTITPAWSSITSTPTTLSGYGITDALSNSTTATQSGYFGDIFLYDDVSPSHYLGITNSANLTAARTLSVNVNDANRTLSLSGNLTVSATATVSGTNTGDQTITLTGDVTGSGTGSFSATLANSGVSAGTYRSVTVDAKGRVTAGTNPTTLSGYGVAATDVTGQALTNYTVGSNTALAATDTILEAFQKVQGQINAGGGGTKTIDTFTPLDNNPPATAFATLDTRNSIAVLDFDAATDEAAVFVGGITEGAVLTSGLKVLIFWTATTATSGAVVWGVQFEKTSGGQDIDADGFDTATTGTTTTNGTSGVVNTTTITSTAIDSLAAGDTFRLKVYRDADNGSDTMTGDAELIRVEVQAA